MLHRPGPCTGGKGSRGNALTLTEVRGCAHCPGCQKVLLRAGNVEMGGGLHLGSCRWFPGIYTHVACPEGIGPCLFLAFVATEMQLPLWPKLHLCKTAPHSGIPARPHSNPDSSVTLVTACILVFPAEVSVFSIHSLGIADILTRISYNSRCGVLSKEYFVFLFGVSTFDFSPLQRNSPLQLK